MRISGLVRLCSRATAGMRDAWENIWQSSILAQMVTASPGSGNCSRWCGIAVTGVLPWAACAARLRALAAQARARN
eukprot:13288537-Alexandrium_andersonii.AAC.1